MHHGEKPADLAENTHSCDAALLSGELHMTAQGKSAPSSSITQVHGGYLLCEVLSMPRKKRHSNERQARRGNEKPFL